MANEPVGEICDSIATTLGAATGIVRTQSYDELQDAPGDLPCLQVYPKLGHTDAFTSNSRTTFKSVRRTAEMEFNADVLCRQRSHLDLDYSSVITMQDAVQQELEGEKTKPFFGNAEVMDFWWSWEVMDFQRGGPGGEVHYLGVRFVITVRVG